MKAINDIIGKSFFIIVGTIAIGVLLWSVGYGIYQLVTTVVPHWVVAASGWWYDTTTIIAQHHWQATDGVLYGGMIVILSIRYRDSLHKVWSRLYQYV